MRNNKKNVNRLFKSPSLLNRSSATVFSPSKPLQPEVRISKPNTQPMTQVSEDEESDDAVRMAKSIPVFLEGSKFNKCSSVNMTVSRSPLRSKRGQSPLRDDV